MKRPLLIAAGFAALLLGAIGAVVPVLPTTPFLLLAAACFAQSSPRWHQWLLENPYTGPMIRDWEERRCISSRTRAVALVTMTVMGGLSITLALESIHFRLGALMLIALGAVTVLRIPICRECNDGE